MKKLEFGSDATLPQVLESIKASEEENIDLNLPEDSQIFTNSINKEIIKKVASKSGKHINLVGLDHTPSLKVKGDQFGFVEGKDIVDHPKPAEESIPKEPKTPAPSVPANRGGIFGFFSKFSKRKKFLIWGVTSVVAILLMMVTSFWFLPSAEVTLNIDGEVKTNQLTLTASEKISEVDLENKVIPLTVEQVTKSDEGKRDSSGKLTVGSTAKGRVTVGNFSIVTSKKYPAGTTLKSVSGQNKGLEFTLDTEVTVPKASPSGFSIIAGQAGVNITAKKIGSEGNLPASTEFQIGSENIGTIKGVNDLALSGGDSKEVKAVSKEDRDKLKEDLLEELSKKAEEELESKLEGAKVPEGGLKTEILEEKFDKAVGEEADKVSLTLKVKATAKLFQESDLKKLMIESIKLSLPDGLKVDEQASTVEAELFETEGEADIEILGKIKVVLVPDIGEENLQDALKGKSFSAAASFLQSQENISGFEIEIKPAIFRLFKFMPFNRSRIDIIVNFQGDTSTEPDNSEKTNDEGSNKNAE